MPGEYHPNRNLKKKTFPSFRFPDDIYSLALAATLPTLPFEVFRQLLNCSPLTTDDGVILRRMIIEVGAMHLVLNCLGIFTHHSQMYQLTSTTGLQEVKSSEHHRPEWGKNAFQNDLVDETCLFVQMRPNFHFETLKTFHLRRKSHSKMFLFGTFTAID